MLKTLSILSLLLLAYPIKLSATDYFPKVENWKKSEEAKLYNSETLWEYINGAADYYLSFDFKKLEVVEYSQSEDVYIKAEIYYHSSPINAFGIYTYERTNEVEFIAIGNEGYRVYSTFNFYNKNCYVKVISNNSDDATIKTIAKIAKQISINIDSLPSLPKELSFLPKTFIEHTDKYTSRNFLGYSFLKGVISAKYSVKNEPLDFFYILSDSDTNAESIVQQYFDFIKVEDKIVPNKIYELNDLFNGDVYIVISDKKILGIVNSKNQETAKAFLNSVISE